MNLGLSNKKALVTGGGRGIGREIALQLAREGARVAVVSRTKSELETLVNRMGGKRKGHLALPLDLTCEGAPEKVIRMLRKYFGDPDILINNLGSTLNIRDPFCTSADWRKLWRINIEVAIELNNLVIPKMVKKHWGRIVHISSVSAIENQGSVPYCTLKAALTAYSRSMGRLLAPSGIVMSSVLPGAVFTKGGDWEVKLRNQPEHVTKYIRERMPIGRLGTPAEIAPLVVFLASPLASFCVGSAMSIDGGQARRFYS